MRPRRLGRRPLGGKRAGHVTGRRRKCRRGERQCTRGFSVRVVASLGGLKKKGGGKQTTREREASGQGSAPTLTAAAAAADVRHRRSAPGIPLLAPLFPCHAKGSRQRACGANFPAHGATGTSSDGAYVAETTCYPPLIPGCCCCCICKRTLRDGKIPLL